eukprot:4571154-Pleurochrysis_carterae.AAC.1
MVQLLYCAVSWPYWIRLIRVALIASKRCSSNCGFLVFGTVIISRAARQALQHFLSGRFQSLYVASEFRERATRSIQISVTRHGLSRKIRSSCKLTAGLKSSRPFTHVELLA